MTQALATWVSGAMQVGISGAQSQSRGWGASLGEKEQKCWGRGGHSEDCGFTAQGGATAGGFEQGVTPRDLLLKSCFQLTLKGSLVGGERQTQAVGQLKVLFQLPTPGLGRTGVGRVCGTPDEGPLQRVRTWTAVQLLPGDVLWPGASMGFGWLSGSPGVSKEWQTGSGVSLLWGEVCKTQVSEDVFLCSHMDKRLLLRVIQPPAIQPQPPLGPAEAAKLTLKMLGASPAKQGKGVLANGDDHQVHTHSLPGGAGPLGPLHSSP